MSKFNVYTDPKTFTSGEKFGRRLFRLRLHSLGERPIDFRISGKHGNFISIWRRYTPTGAIREFEDEPQDCIVFEFPVASSFKVILGEKAFEVDEASFLCLGAHKDQVYHLNEGADVYCVFIYRNILKAAFADIYGREYEDDFEELVPTDGNILESIKESVIKLYNQVMSDDQSASSFMLEVMLIDNLIRNWPKRCKDGLRGSEATVARKVRRAQEFIELNMANPITVDEIAAHADISVSGLSKGFKTLIGVSPNAYLINRRLDEARHFLEENGTAVQVSDAACRFGFKHMSYFSKMYLARFGCLPSHTRLGKA